jgi:UDP-N-acetylglucosamine--N-acetylmuramyl-(pentapeptide) pyrophosphoryl-undecaprenol N-acetylglucosamine transferase
MRFVITAGGTAGHIYPALAVAQALIAAGHEVHYAGTPAGPESRIIPEAGIPYTAFAATGFDRAKPLSLLTSTLRLARSAAKARKWLRELAPDAVAGFGGYVSIPVGLAANRCRIPLLIHEQNSTPGLANRYLARHAAAIALTYALPAGALRARVEPVITGNPVRPAFEAFAQPGAKQELRRQGRAAWDIPQSATVLMVFGGSQGAKHINEAVAALAPALLERHQHLHILHLTGRRDHPAIQEICAHTRWHLVDYCERMPEAYAAADLVVSRAGASSLAEIAAVGVPTVLVPFPHATGDHQTANAKTLVAAGAARMVTDARLDDPFFSETIHELLEDEAAREAMVAAAEGLRGGEDATAAILNMLLNIAK